MNPTAVRTAAFILAISLVAFRANAQNDGLPPLPPMPQVKPQLPAPDAFVKSQMLSLDKNNDAKITWTEFSAQLRKAFDEMDTERRGHLRAADIRKAYIEALKKSGIDPAALADPGSP